MVMLVLIKICFIHIVIGDTPGKILVLAPVYLTFIFTH